MALVAGLCAILERGGWAGENDLVVTRLAQVDNTAGVGPCGVGIRCDVAGYRSLVSELGTVIAPRWSAPADTLGWSGFQLSAELGTTSISDKATYWRTQQKLSSINDVSTSPNGTLPTFSVFARKGIPLPFPSMEVGAGMLHVLGSSLYAFQGYAKLALHEGYHGDLWPSVAMRFGMSRLYGTEQLSLTVLSADALLSKRFTVGSMATMTPYAGWSRLYMLVRAQALDATPNVDAFGAPADLSAVFVFPNPKGLHRDRLVVGVEAKSHHVTLTAEYAMTFAGSTSDGDATDQAGRQHSTQFGVGVDF